MQSKTFDEFWQMFLQVNFHLGNPERWTKRETKAQWCESTLQLPSGTWIADLGCGDGILDIWLSRMGYKVSAIDQGSSVIAHARMEDDTDAVLFETNNLQNIHFPEGSLDGVLILETLGLMNIEKDADLLARAFTWLKPGGKLITDCPINPPAKNNWSKDFADGRVDAFTSFNEGSQIHQLNFEFHPKTGEPFNLHDPSTGNTGITRYIYTQTELTALMQKVGFHVRNVNHYYGESYFALLGSK